MRFHRFKEELLEEIVEGMREQTFDDIDDIYSWKVTANTDNEDSIKFWLSAVYELEAEGYFYKLCERDEDEEIFFSFIPTGKLWAVVERNV